MVTILMAIVYNARQNWIDRNAMKKTFFILTIIILMIGWITSCSTSTDPAEAYKGETPQQIFHYGKTALQDRNYSEAIKRFEALDVQYPFGRETETAQMYLIYAYYMKEDYALAVAEADRFIRLHPTNPHIDYAYYMRGVADYYQNLGFLERLFAVDLATRDLTQIKKSYHDFDVVYTRFPSSPYAAPAHQYMVYLRNVLANHELQVARFYYERKAYVAAANRASELVAHYQGAPSVVDALVLMIKSYHKLNMTKQQQDTYVVLRYNYPDAVVDLNS